MWLSKMQKPIQKSFNKRQALVRNFSGKQGQFFPTIPSNYRLHRFYKKVGVIEHPKQSEKQRLTHNDKIDFTNLSLSSTYYAVTLDDKPLKTLYKDDLFIPTKALAVALAQEWDSQIEKIDLKSLHLHNFIGRAVRVESDPDIHQHMKEELTALLENDQICFRERENEQNEYKVGLSKAQREHTSKIFDTLFHHFGITLKIFHDIQLEPQDPSFSKIDSILENIDPFALTSLYQVAQTSKSTAIAMCLILRDDLDIQEAVNIARVDENYQTQVFGKVEGAHDFDEAHTLSTFATAKSLINLCRFRAF